ncbi:MAG TPA: hypothetical protein DIT03_10150 [Candidatus Accumulibacter sp.]|nr:MAG: hypothetical protein AW07_03131 [Candidatus Accumulibacter sp. SK-11]HAY29341.1 hypothetical protein [Accumulibacter sp.]HCN68608.1 hypothetical protein [Accumulibacter sp.]
MCTRSLVGDIFGAAETAEPTGLCLDGRPACRTAFDGDPPPFELLAQQNGFRFWLAFDLARALGYADTKPLRKALNKAPGVSA